MDILLRHISHARFVYNVGLEQRKMLDETTRNRGVRLSCIDQTKQLTQARAEYEWLREGSAVVQQGALRDLDRAFQNFFAGRARFPQFRRRGHGGTVPVRDMRLRRLNRKWAEILVPKAGWLRFRITYAWSDIIKATSARVSLRNGKWHVALTTPPRAKRTGGTGVVGIDRGVAVSVMTSDGEALNAPSLTAGEQARFLSLERRYARTSKGSRRREQTRAKMATLRGTLNDRRRDWMEQETTRLAETYATAAVENLRIKNMVAKPAPKPDGEGGYLPNGAAAKSGLARAIQASQWGEFAQRLADKMDVVKVPAANTSRRCHECGHIAAENRESQAEFRCVDCGHTANADVNAAKNIRDLAVCGGTRREWAKPSGDANLQRT